MLLSADLKKRPAVHITWWQAQALCANFVLQATNLRPGNEAGGKLHYNSQYQYKCLTHSRGGAWCYSPALLCHQSFLRNVQSDFTVLKPDPQGSLLHCIMAIAFSHKLQWNSSFEPAVLSDRLFIQANMCKFWLNKSVQKRPKFSVLCCGCQCLSMLKHI